MEHIAECCKYDGTAPSGLDGSVYAATRAEKKEEVRRHNRALFWNGKYSCMVDSNENRTDTAYVNGATVVTVQSMAVIRSF
jgi:hypothetical protein